MQLAPEAAAHDRPLHDFILVLAICKLHLVDNELYKLCGASCMTCHSWKESGAAGAQQAANGVFVFDAASVTFVNASSLILSGLPNSTAYVQYPPRVNAGTFAKVIPFPKPRAYHLGPLHLPVINLERCLTRLLKTSHALVCKCKM